MELLVVKKNLKILKKLLNFIYKFFWMKIIFIIAIYLFQFQMNFFKILFLSQ